MLARVAQQDRKLPGFRAQQWYFFFVATFYLYLRYGHGSQQEGSSINSNSTQRLKKVVTWIVEPACRVGQ